LSNKKSQLTLAFLFSILFNLVHLVAQAYIQVVAVAVDSF